MDVDQRECKKRVMGFLRHVDDGRHLSFRLMLAALALLASPLFVVVRAAFKVGRVKKNRKEKNDDDWS